MKPFSPDYFNGAHPRLFSFCTDFYEGALALSRENREPRIPFLTATLDESPTENQRMFISDLLQFFKAPQKYFLEHRLSLQFIEPSQETMEREPFSLEGLERFLVGDLALKHERTGIDPSRTMDIAFGTGIMPLGTPGRLLYGRLQKSVQSITHFLPEEFRHAVFEKRFIRLLLARNDSSIALEGTIDGFLENNRAVITFSKIASHHLVAEWIRHLCATLNAPPGNPVTTRIFGRPANEEVPEVITFFPVEQRAELLLLDLVDIFMLGKRTPLPFFLSESHDYARKDAKGTGKIPDYTNAESTARADAFCSLAYRGTDPYSMLDENGNNVFSELANRVFRPLLSHCTTEKLRFP